MTDISNFNRAWEIKVSAAPRIPRGSDGYVSALKIILNSVQNGILSNEKIIIPGSTSSLTLDELCITLRPLGFVRQPSRKEPWELTEFSKAWIDNKSNMYLGSYINGNLKFFSEILESCKEPKKISELRSIADSFYKIYWKDNSQIYDRLHWLRDMGFIEHLGFKKSYVTTELGLSFLKKVPAYNWEDLEKDNNIVFDDLETIREVFLSLVPQSQEDLETRKRAIGYIPGNSNDIFNVIVGYLDLISSGKTNINIISRYSNATYEIKETSVISFMTHLTSSGFVEKVSTEDYELTKLGYSLLKDRNLLNLTLCYHAKYLFFLEILQELKEKPLAVKEIMYKSVSSYGFPKENLSEIRKRLSLLTSAQLIYLERKKYHLTKKGEDILQIVPLQRPSVVKKESDNFSKTNLTLEKIIEGLLSTSRDSSNSAKFEELVSDAFSYIGFKTKWLGGSGNTDVLLTAPTAPKFSYKVNIDTKATYSGPVSDNQVDFDSLAEHKEKHNADFIVIIGNYFSSERLEKRAKNHNVGLLDVNTMIALLRKHQEVPISFESYKKLFQQVGSMKLFILENERESMLRQGKLMKAIVEALYFHSENDMATAQNLFWFLTRDETFEPKPKESEILDMLEFLSSPLISCIGKTKEGYYAKGSLSDTIRKFQFYINQLL